MEINLVGLILSFYDEDGNYNGPMPRMIFHKGVAVNIDDYAAEHNITLPDAGE